MYTRLYQPAFLMDLFRIIYMYVVVLACCTALPVPLFCELVLLYTVPGTAAISCCYIHGLNGAWEASVCCLVARVQHGGSTGRLHHDSLAAQYMPSTESYRVSGVSGIARWSRLRLCSIKIVFLTFFVFTVSLLVRYCRVHVIHSLVQQL